MKPDFIEYIQDRLVLGDGALGSYLLERGVARSRNLDLLTLQAPEIVFGTHEEYIRAGSQLIETNTFGANRFKLAETEGVEKISEINRLGAEIAVKAAGHQVYVAGSVGPTGLTFPLDDNDFSEADVREGFAEQLTGLVLGGVDLFIIETFSNLDEIKIAIETAREIAPDIPVIAQMVFPTRGVSVRGEDALSCGRAMLAAGASIVGTNCGRGIDTMVTAIEKMSVLDQEDVPLSAFPNAGLPEMMGGRMIYPAQPSYMAIRAREMIKLGVHLIGGCCGTTPAHIQEFRSTLKIRPVRVRTRIQTKTQDKDANLSNKIHPGGFIESLPVDRLPIIVEIDPPAHLHVDPVLTGAAQLAENGADAISLGENPLAILRTGNLGVASLIRKQTGIQTIIHQTGRDINALGLQSRMMEAHLLGIEAVLAVSGDSASATDQPGVTGIFDLRSFGLIRMLAGLNQGKNMAERSIKGETNFSIGAAFSFRPASPDLQVTRLEKKVALGACYAMTQPLFDKETVERMMEETAHIDVLIFPGIFPLISARNAEFLHNEVPGISVPQIIRKKLSGYEQVQDQRKAALDYTAQLVDEIASFVDGLYFISPLNKWQVALEFVKQVRSAGLLGSGRVKKFQRKEK